MNSNVVFVLALGIGIATGLRTFTGAAAVCWAAHLGWLNLHETHLAFMGSVWAVGIFTLLALVEYVGDLLPNTPARTTPFQLIARIVMGGLSGACMYAAATQSPLLGAVLGAIGAVIGTYAGYHARKALVTGLKINDAFIAIPEDIVAIGLALLIVHSR